MESLDGLAKWAREFKDTPLFKTIEANAKRKHTDEETALREINFQFDCFAKMPKEHIEIALDNQFDYNIALIWFFLYGSQSNASLSDFKLCVPDAEYLGDNEGFSIMSWGRLVFAFKDDVLKSAIIN